MLCKETLYRIPDINRACNYPAVLASSCKSPLETVATALRESCSHIPLQGISSVHAVRNDGAGKMEDDSNLNNVTNHPVSFPRADK